MTLPRVALEKAEEVIHMYMGLMTQSDKPVDWNCEEEFTEDYPESSTEPLSQTAGIITAKKQAITLTRLSGKRKHRQQCKTTTKEFIKNRERSQNRA